MCSLCTIDNYQLLNVSFRLFLFNLLFVLLEVPPFKCIIQEFISPNCYNFSYLIKASTSASCLLSRQGYSLLSWEWRRRDALRPTSYLDNAPAIKYLFHFAFFFHNIAVYKSLIVHELLVYFNSKLMMWCRIYHEMSFSSKINSTYTYSGLSLNGRYISMVPYLCIENFVFFVVGHTFFHAHLGS